MNNHRVFKIFNFLARSIGLLICLLFSVSVLAQNNSVKITGTVFDNYGDPVIGANVVEVGTSNGTITDLDGNFFLTVSSSRSSLLVTYIGYEPQTFALTGKDKVSITIKEDLLNLDEVVVVGYGTARKRDVTGSVASVKGEKIKERATFNAAQALQGQASGVAIVQTNARPGEDPQIRIRGTRSLKGGNDPLFVVDGIPITTALGEISPSDIESMEILKDASATAIYGSRGANGVILITTKKGKAGKAQIDYNGYYGIQHAARRIKMMDGNEFVDMVREANRNTTLTTPYPFEPNMDADRRIGYLSNDPRVWSKIENAYDENGVWHPEWLEYTDWTGEALRNAAIQNHEVSVRGGTEKMRILGSATYFKQDGVVRGQDYERYSVRVNFDWDITERITIGGQTQFSHVKRNLATNLYGDVKRINPLADIYDDEGNYIEDRPGNDPVRWNYFLDLDNVQNIRMNDRFLGSYYIDVKLPLDLNFRSNVGIDIRHHEAPEFYGSMSSDRQGAQSRAFNKKETRRLYTWENLLFYNKKINNDHILGVTFLQSIQQQTTDHVQVNVEDLPYENQWWYNVGSAETITGVGSGYERWRLASFMGRVNYNFKDRYLLTISARYDGSSRLAPGNKWVLFPSAALAWRINEEAFLKNVEVLNNLKLRLGYGITGNTAIDPYKTQGSLSYGRYIFDSTGVMAFRQNEMPNPYLTWEKTEQWNLGVDFGFFNGRLNGVIDMYLQNTSDLLMERQLPVVSGFEKVLSNVGKTRNKGIEVTLNTLNINNKNFSWSTDFIFARNKEEIVELYNGKDDDEGNNWFIGSPLNVFYNYKADGIWQLEDAEELEKWGGAFKPGDIKIVDRNGDNKITAEDRFILGQKDPKYNLSMTNSFRYKDFDLSIFLNAGLGFMKEYDAEWTLHGRFGGASVNFWRIVGYDDHGNPISNGSNEAPRPSIDHEMLNYIQSLYRVDASFLRIGQITLGYTIPSNLTRKLGIQSLRLYGSVQNVHVFTGFKGTDPESGTNFNAPMPRTSMVGINLSF